jgi:hypothetical protein
LPVLSGVSRRVSTALADGPVKTLAMLSLAPEHRRGHGALYDAVNHDRIDIARLAAAGHRRQGDLPVLVVRIRDSATLETRAQMRVDGSVNVSEWLGSDALAVGGLDSERRAGAMTGSESGPHRGGAGG